jgi:autotransporter-associated beta strand protein
MLAAGVSIVGSQTARAANITFSTPATLAGDADVLNAGESTYAYDWSTAQTVNGVPFTATAATGTVGGGNITLSGFSGANASVFTSTVNPFNNLSAAYKASLVGSVFNATSNTLALVTLNNLTFGRKYQVQLWAGDPRTGNTTNRAEWIYDGIGGATNLVKLNMTATNGGLGQWTLGSFTADSSSQNFTLDATAPGNPGNNNVVQMNAIQVRDVTGVWSGTSSGSWADSDSSSANFTGLSFSGVKGLGVVNVDFGDRDGNGVTVATSAITVGAGGASGVNAVFQNSSVAYTLGSADATGITGGNGVTLNGAGSVTFNGANTYTGPTTLNSGTLALGNANAIANSSAIVLNGGTLDVSALGSLSLGSSQTISGSGTIRGSVAAPAGSVIVPGGLANAGTLTVTNNLTLNAQTMTFDLGFTPSGGDKIVIGSTLTVNSTCTLSLNYLQGALLGGTYTLMTFASKTGAGTFVLDTSYPGVTLNVNPTSVTLTVGGGGGGTSGVWTNLAGGTWGATTNWQGNTIATNVDGVADFSTLNITGARTVTINGIKTIGYLVFGDTVQDANWTLSTGTNVMAVSSGSPTIVVNSGQNTTINASLQGTQGFTKLGAGTLTLTGANRLTNAVNVLGGALALGVNNPFGPVTNSSQIPLTLSNAVLTVSGAFLLTNNIILPAGTSNYISAIPTSAGLYGSTGNPLSGGGTLVMNIGGANPRLDGGDNQNFTGKLIVNSTGAGGLLTAFDDPSSLPRFGYAGSSNAIYVLNGTAGSLFYMGTSDWVGGGRAGCTNYLGELDGAATLFANNGRSGTTTLEIGGLNTSSTFSGVINDNHLGASPYTPMIVRKVGTGSLTLSGTSTYTGATEVRGGTLDVTGSLGNTPVTVYSGTFQLDGSIGSSNITVNSGGDLVLGSGASLGSAAITLTGVMDTTASGGGGGYNLGSASLSGSGIVSGSITLGGATLNPGAIGAAGLLTVTNGNFTASAGTLQFDLSNTPGSGNDLLDVNGNLDFSAPGVTISVNKLVGSLGAGTYVLAKCSGTLSGSVGNLTLVGAGPLDTLQVTGNQLQLVVSSVPSLTWTGDGSGNLWDIGTSTCWLNGASPSTFANGNAVSFNNTGSSNPVVNVSATVAPAVVNVSGSSSYTLVGSGDISDGASVIKSGTGTLTILDTNSFTGGLFLNSGVTAIGNAGTNGSVAGNITNGATLSVVTPLDQLMTNTIGGTGSFTKSGAGVLTLTANNTISGPTTVSAGTLSVGDGSTPSGALGSGVVTNNATLVVNQTTALTMSNPIRNTGTIIKQGAGTVVLAGTISGNGTLINNDGPLELAAANTYSGPTAIMAGTVMLRNMAGFGTSSVSIDDAGGGAINIAPTASQTNVIPNNIKLPAATTSQFVITDESLTSMTTVRLTGLISGGVAAGDTRLVNGGGTPVGNPRLTIILENAANSFTMTPDVYQGCLAFTSDGALGDPNNGIIVQSTAQFPGSGFTDATSLVGLRFDANNITLNANRSINLVGNEIINVQSYNGTIAGPISGLGMNKLGAGTLSLNGPGSLTGGTTVSAGTLLINNSWSGTAVSVASGATLGGTGTSLGYVSVASGGVLSPGPSIGTLTVSNSVILASGSTNLMEINAGSLACDKVIGVTSLSYGGTLNVVNLGGTLAAGQSFQLFSATNYTGNFAATNLPALSNGLSWNWNPATGTLSVSSSVSTSPTSITAVLSGGNLNLSWPADHLGWRLQGQTNVSGGLGATWATVPGSTNVNNMTFPVDHADGSVFFRLIYP